MKVVVLTVRDGRDDVHERSMESLKANFPQPDEHIVIDDADHKLGFSGAIQAGWEKVLETDADWVLHHEADFLFHRPVAIDRMIATLERRPYLAQLCLKRQPWNEAEKAAGGIVECHPENYEQRVEAGDIWTEHTMFFSTNPSVYPAALCHHGWPQVPESEGIFTHLLRDDPAVRFAFWGPKLAPPLVEHIGVDRTGTGY